MALIKLFIAALVFVACVHGQTITPAPPSDVAIAASTPAIHDGFTKYLTINCTYNHRQGSDFSTIMSLILSKAQPNSSTFTEVTSVTAYSGGNVDTADNLGADVTGHLEHMSVSFIAYEWKYPAKSVEGDYKCEAFGMDMKGHPRSAEATTTIIEAAVDMNMILHNMEKMDKELDELLTFKQDMTSRLARSMAALMEFSSAYKGSSYHMSHPMVRNTAVAASLCRLYGQVLLEVDDQDEFDFVAGFLKTNAANDVIALGVTDEAAEGHWKLMSSGASPTFMNWEAGHGIGGADMNCLYLGNNNSSTTAMFDDACFGLQFDRFICEDE